MRRNPGSDCIPRGTRRLTVMLASLGVLLVSFAIVDGRSSTTVAAQSAPVGQDQSPNPTPSGLATLVATAVADDCSVAPAETAHDETEQAMLAAINVYRQQHGLQPVVASTVLGQAAAWMSTDMADHGYVSHTDRYGRSPAARVGDCGYASDAWTGENIAAGAGDVTVTLTDWQQSPSHDALLLKPSVRVIGIGRYCEHTSQYGCYWTLEAGDAVEAVASLTDAPPPPSAALPRAGELSLVASAGADNDVRTTAIGRA